MRIVAGRFRGRRIASPPTDSTRPMLDRVREAVFSTLGEAVEGARVLDLFAGAGSLGLEASSRGARFVRFVERDRATRQVLADNARSLGISEEVDVVGGDALALRAREAPPRFGGDSRWIELAFLDPPYALWKERRERQRLLAALEDILAQRLAPGGSVVLHTHPRDLAERELAFAASVRWRDYGNSRVWYLAV